MVLGAVLAGVSALAPAIPSIVQGLSGVFGGQKPPAGTPLMTQQTQLGGYQRPQVGAQLGAPTLAPWQSLLKTGAPTPTQTGAIAPNRKSARVNQRYYTASGQIRTKRSSRRKKKKKAPSRRRRRLSKSDKYKMAFAALAGGAQMNQIAALNMLMG